MINFPDSVTECTLPKKFNFKFVFIAALPQQLYQLVKTKLKVKTAKIIKWLHDACDSIWKQNIKLEYWWDQAEFIALACNVFYYSSSSPMFVWSVYKCASRMQTVSEMALIV